MKDLRIKDFLLHMSSDSFGHYFSHEFEDGNEICLEGCMNGYCVAIYDKQKDLIGEKTCTNLTDIDRVPFGPQIGDTVALTAAIEVANVKMKELYAVLN